MSLNINLFGHYGSGKGTQRKLLMAKYGLGALEIGETIRLEIEAKTPLSATMDEYIQKGELVPDRYIIKMMETFFATFPAEKGIVFDGVPRTLAQKKLFDEELGKFNRKTLNVELAISDETSFVRQTHRNEQRPDQNADVARTRIQQYKEFVQPVIDAYEQEGNMIRINGEGKIEDIFSEICKHVEKYGNHN